MKGAALFGILVVSILIMGGSFYYFHTQDQKILPKFSISLDFKDNSSFNASYPITLSGVPSGNGMYQQLITLNNYSKYGINDNGSNIEFFDAFNLTHLYAWIQSINSTSMQVWVKNYNASNAIDMQVLPEFENLFSASGYLGEAPQLSSVYGEYFNAYNVFPYATDFQSYSEFKGYIDNSTGNVVINNGLNVTQGYGPSSCSNMGVTLGYAPTTRDVLYIYIANYYLFGGSGDRNNNPQGFGWSQDGATVYERYQAGLSGNPVYGINEFGSGQYGISISTIGGNSVPSIGLSSIYFNALNYVLTTSPSGYQNYEVSPSTTVNSSEPAYAEIGNWNNAYNTTMVVYYSFIATPPNAQDIMPTFTIGSAYHPLSSFSISSNSLVVNTTFMEHNLTGYQYYAFSPVYNGNPVWFLVNGQIGDRLSVLLDGNVSLTVQILGYSYSNIIKEVKVE